KRIRHRQQQYVHGIAPAIRGLLSRSLPGHSFTRRNRPQRKRLFGSLNDEIVLHTEHTGGGIGLYSSDGFVVFAIDGPVENDIAVSNDNMDRVKAARRIVYDAARHANGVAAGSPAHGATAARSNCFRN